MLGAGEVGQRARVVDVPVPRLHELALAVAAAVPDGVQGVEGEALGGQPSGQRLVEAQVLAEAAVAEDDDALDVAVRQPGFVVDPSSDADEERHHPGPFAEAVADASAEPSGTDRAR